MSSHLTDLSLLKWLGEHLSVSLQDPSAVIESVEVGHIMTLHISSKHSKNISLSLVLLLKFVIQDDPPVSVQELECMVPQFLSHLGQSQ